MLVYNYPKIDSIKIFYYKRAKSIYPSFYIAFLPFFLQNVYKAKTFFYNAGANPFSIILTILGIDGYFYYVAPNYYILGEWFLGAVVMMYFLYPVILYLFSHHYNAYIVGSTALFLLVNFYNVFAITPMRNLITCNFCFMIGMLALHNRKVLTCKLLLLCSAIIAVWLYLMPVSVNLGLIIEILYAFALFIVLYNIRLLVMGLKWIGAAFKSIGGISYQIFLLQHIMVCKVLSYRQPYGTAEYWSELAVTIICTIAGAYILKKLTQLALKTQIYRDFEGLFLTKRETGIIEI